MVDCTQLLEKAPADLNTSLPHITEDDLLRMEQRNKDVAMRALASIGKDVTTEAQTIFDALNKTYVTILSYTRHHGDSIAHPLYYMHFLSSMPCEWEGQNIRVMGDVLIKPPYQPQNCVSENAQVLSRVKKVLEGEKNKLKKAKK